ncbi:TPA: hypothetical protein ACNGY8_006032 [Klebsiella michiganensis]
MKVIKYWSIQLFRLESKGMAPGVSENLIFDGYSKDKPEIDFSDDSSIELLVHPDRLESRIIRIRTVDIVLCTPVYGRNSGSNKKKSPEKDLIDIVSGRHYGSIGEQVRLRVIEKGDSDVVVSSSDENIVKATYYADRELFFSCIGLGQARITLTKGKSKTSIDVHVGGQ